MNQTEELLKAVIFSQCVLKCLDNLGAVKNASFQSNVIDYKITFKHVEKVITKDIERIYKDLHGIDADFVATIQDAFEHHINELCGKKIEQLVTVIEK